MTVTADDGVIIKNANCWDCKKKWTLKLFFRSHIYVVNKDKPNIKPDYLVVSKYGYRKGSIKILLQKYKLFYLAELVTVITGNT